jgi:hypothetical protein
MQISELSDEKIQEMPLKELSNYLYPGDIPTIRRMTGYSKPYIFFVISGKRSSKIIEKALRERVRQNRELCQFHKDLKGVHNA